MGYVLPTFVLEVNVWRNALDYTTDPPTDTVVGNLAYGRRTYVQYWPWADTQKPGIFAVLLLPAHTDVRDVFNPSGADWLEIPAGTGRWYAVDYVDDAGKGFDNEHRFVVCHKTTEYSLWPEPIP